MEDNNYDRDSDYFDDDVNYEDQYNYQNASNQFNMYELHSLNYYPEPNDQQWQIQNHQQSEQFDERTYDRNEFNNQNRNTHFEEHWKNLDMTSQGYERNNFNDRDRYFQDYNTNYRKYTHANDEQNFHLSERDRRYNEQQEIYRRLCNRQLPSFNNDCYRRDYFINKRKFNRERVDDFIIPPVIFSDSQPNRNLEKDKEQWDHNISPSISELRLATEESTDKITTHSIKKTVEEEQIAVYTNPIINNSDDEEDINIIEELSEKEITIVWDNEMFEDDGKMEEDTLQNLGSENSNFTIDLKEEDELENYTCAINDILKEDNDISKSKINRGLNEIKSDQESNEKTIKKSKKLLDNTQTNNEDIAIVENSYSLIERMNSDSPMTELRKGKPPGKIKFISPEQLSMENKEEKKDEWNNQVSNADVIISTNTYAEVKEFVTNTIFSFKSLNQEISEMVKYYISIHKKLLGTHQKYFWIKFLLDTNWKKEAVCRFQENELLQCTIPKIVGTKVLFNRLGIV
ncbi:putative uncharacterized protein DDB_G0282499 [Leptopilina heterotoma]|uniref:putative uncharacterized protein DDB_G0282499 n=1 Tax=Leptopilina heterotoma TaxID=63436 RepID=UPI001CA8F83E|nr:putative uncharacterized protein DDB_G0282499 [Leptopilina heterotoma]